MKKYMLTGMITAMALSLPLLSQAQTSPPSTSTPASPGTYSSQPDVFGQPPSTPQYQTPSSMPSGAVPLNPSMQQTSQMGTPPASGVSNQQPSTTQTQSTVSQTQSSTSTTQLGSAIPTSSSGEVIVGTDAASSTIPQLTVGMGTTVINVLNPSPKQVTFTIPALNMTYDVPANTERTIQIDRTQTASLTPGQVIAYYVNDSSGNQIASSSLVNYNAVASQMNTNTQVATETQTQTTPASETSSVPHPSQRRSSVRGFW